ncbi:putative membrane protein [Candidatus Ichthyocystis hellenicum]|uniref:Putative membrane protein n=1 Tax=Candidatus Ichthyocystis hellenicum TaxID=1561003 RepID=A0A0S4M539_9BURK|nr:hypothetical protein [Candidatus Ichthyocystis hellenicum]CUT18320.1 putative membrane protein [Candidatus Ichthyocystis hellenicum]
MCYVNVRCLKNKDVNKISEASAFTTLVIAKQEENLLSASSNLLSRFSYACRMSPLIVLSMLGSANGLEFDGGSRCLFDRYSCRLASGMCKLIAIDKMAGKDRDYFNFTRDVFIYSSRSAEKYNKRLIEEGNVEKIEKYTIKNSFNFSFPLILPSVNSSENYDINSLVNKLILIHKGILLEIKKYYGESYEKNYHLSDFMFCRPNNRRTFVDPDPQVFSRFCSNIESYLVYPELSLMIETLNNTSTKNPTLDTTEVVPTDKDDVTFFIAFVTFIFFTVSILSLLGRRCYRRYSNFM